MALNYSITMLGNPQNKNEDLSDKTAMFTYIIDIEMFQTSEPTHVKHYEYGHDLGIGKTTRFVSMLFSIVNRMFFNSFIKKCRSRLPYRKFQ